ncbi:MAG: hypothetical protein ACSLFF_02285 [Solirubrobacterales bacterium]
MAEPAPVRADGLIPESSILGRISERLGGYSPLLRWYRALRPRWLWLRLDPIGKATRRYLAGNDLTVKRGYAEGISYPPKAVARIGFLSTKLIGAYEHELDEPLEQAVPGHDLFVDIGSGDGYYCLATKKRFPEVRVIGYETDDAERKMAGEMASMNGVEIELRGTAEPAEFAGLPDGRLFVMTDVEGYEFELMDPVKIPRLLTSTMLIEVHPATREGLRATLIERFADTHTHEVILGEPKDLAAYPELKGWPHDIANMAITEGRPALPEWLLLTPTA